MVSMLAVPVPAGRTLYQIVLERPDPTGTQAGAGSLLSVAAPELSFVSVKLVDVMLIAFAKLSFVGAGAITVNVGRICVCEVAVPPPGGGFWTPTEFMLPKPAMKLAGTVAERCVESVNVVGIAVPPTSGFMSTLEVVPKFVPVTVIGVFGEFTRALVGEMLDIVGA